MKLPASLPPRRLALLGVLAATVLGGAYATYDAGSVEAAPAPRPATAAVPAPVAAAHGGVPAVPTRAAAAATPVSATPAPAPAALDAGVARGRPPVAQVPDTVVLEREVYGYAGSGRRDPFRPLIVTTVLRPFPNELRLTAVAYDPTGANSVAILRDVTTKAQHRVRAGQLVGRMRVVRIQPKAVVFAVEELGFSRRETLTLQDSLGSRQP